MAIKYINLTSETVVLNDGKKFNPSGNTISIVTKDTSFNKYFGTPSRIVQGLPKRQTGTYYIVSKDVYDIVCRYDMVYPAYDHPKAIKQDGKVVSVPGFFGRERLNMNNDYAKGGR